jgi:hypothetical protein
MDNKINFGITCKFGYALFNLRIKIMAADADRIKLAYASNNYHLNYNERHGHYKFEGIMPLSEFEDLYNEIGLASDNYKIEMIKLKRRFKNIYRCTYTGTGHDLIKYFNDAEEGDNNLPF